MFSNSKKKDTAIDLEQKELFEHAQARIKEKRGLYRHFIVFLVGCIFMIVLNLGLNFGNEFKFLDLDWFVFGVLIWSFFFLIHFFRVTLFSKFMGKAWKDKQLERLVAKQKAQIAKMEKKLNLEIPKDIVSEKSILLDNTDNNGTEILQ
ncbi:2TM domain-containing protein [Aquimarina agarivorans]|uniref:2TM domain-containing protein n=1 Tax=Aquimarina agarivorans TaxID=980584 RepID=UPI000248ED09|nr:2TM domain-containing protein [Aquimarina agarivorans]